MRQKRWCEADAARTDFRNRSSILPMITLHAEKLASQSYVCPDEYAAVLTLRSDLMKGCEDVNNILQTIRTKEFRYVGLPEDLPCGWSVRILLYGRLIYEKGIQNASLQDWNFRHERRLF
jgi:hypothetical protein